MISISEGQLRLGGEIIFDELSWQIDPNKRYGLVGANGSGKTSILRVLTGEYNMEKGRIERVKNLRLGYLPQDGVEVKGETVHEILWSAFDDLNRMESTMHDLMYIVESTDDASADHRRALHRYSELQESFQEKGGYNRESEAKKVLLGLGFEHKDWDRPVREFSGGWRMRVFLAKLLLEKPDLYLLDEPTNHLDSVSLAWFEQYLNSTNASMVVVSHDRYFLDRVISFTVEIENSRLTVYSGNYSKYKVLKATRKEQLLAQRKNQERELEHLQSYVDRYRADKRRASQAQSRMKRIEKIDLVEIDPELETITIPLPETPRSGLEVLKLENLGHCYGDVRALHPFSGFIYRGDRLAIWGVNGAGKSTLLSLMAKKFEPSEGQVEWGYNTHVGYFSQHQAEMQTSTKTVLDELAGYAPPEMYPRLRDVLAPFLFRGDDVFKNVSVLSGGEKSRLAMATLLVKPVNVLIMDEPLNHLDIATVETLEQTLQKFEGTLIFVSHDRFFVDRLANQVWEMSAGHIKVYRGNYHDYEYAKECEAEQAAVLQPAPVKKSLLPEEDESGGSMTREQKKEQKRKEAEERNRTRAAEREKEKQYKVIEDEIFEVESEISELEAKLASGALIQNPSEMAIVSKRYKTLLERKEILYVQWEEIMEALEG